MSKIVILALFVGLIFLPGCKPHYSGFTHSAQQRDWKQFHLNRGLGLPERLNPVPMF